ncbi:MAG: hypothetical protein ABIT58_03460 [Ferruginibacter sp.]
MLVNNNKKQMTTPTATKPKWLIAIGIPILIFLSCFVITLTPKFKTNDELFSKAILADMLVVAPLIYFLAIRKSNVSKFSVSRIFIIGLLVAGLIVNTHSNSFLQIIRTWVSPIIEAVIIFVIGRKFYLAKKRAKKTQGKKVDFLMHCRAIMCEVTGNEKFGNIVASEIAVLYYTFFGVKDKGIDNETKFTSHKENGITIILWAILSIFVIETTGMHFLLSLWNNTVAWVVTGLSFYTCIQLFAHIRAVKARPIIINTDTLEIHNGLAGDAYIQFDNVESFELSKKIPQKRNTVKIALLNAFENHNIVVYLKEPIMVTKIFGIKKSADTVLFYVDRSTEFSKALTSQLQSPAPHKTFTDL